MATRALIRVEGFTAAALYKHWDGHPDETLRWLESFNQNLFKHRWVDPSYHFAQLIRSSTIDAVEYVLDDNKYTGWGVVEHDAKEGQEYEYLLHSDGSVTYRSIYSTT